MTTRFLEEGRMTILKVLDTQLWPLLDLSGEDAFYAVRNQINEVFDQLEYSMEEGK